MAVRSMYHVYVVNLSNGEVLENPTMGHYPSSSRDCSIDGDQKHSDSYYPYIISGNNYCRRRPLYIAADNKSIALGEEASDQKLMDSFYSYIFSGNYYYHHGSATNTKNDNNVTGHGEWKSSQVQLRRRILAEIIARLPARTILRFGLVSRDWYSLFGDPLIATAQLAHDNANKVHLIIHPGYQHPKVHLVQCCNSDRGEAHEVFELKPLAENMIVMGSSHGILLCLKDQGEDGRGAIYLYNPLLGEYLQLPESSSRTRKYGLGFHHVRSELKVVRFVVPPEIEYDYNTPDSREPLIIEICDVPIQGNGSGTPLLWRTITSDLHVMYTFHKDVYQPLTLVDGKFHCLTRNMIITFDIESEEIRSIPRTIGEFSIFRIEELGGHLCATTMSICHFPIYMGSIYFKLWVMKINGDPQSWTQILSLTVCDPSYFTGAIEFMVPYMLDQDMILLRDFFHKQDPYMVHHTATLLSLNSERTIEQRTVACESRGQGSAGKVVDGRGTFPMPGERTALKVKGAAVGVGRAGGR